jgi:hypothetical protein
MRKRGAPSKPEASSKSSQPFGDTQNRGREEGTMTRKGIRRASHFVAWVMAGILSCSVAVARKNKQSDQSAAISIQNQLSETYKVATVGTDSTGPQVTNPETATLLDVQKGGILAFPWSTGLRPCPAIYRNSTLQPPRGGKDCPVLLGNTVTKVAKYCPWCPKEIGQANANTPQTKYFDVGDKVYPSDIEVDLSKERIAFSIVACDKCNNTTPPTAYKSEVDFQFDKGFLESSDVQKIEETIGRVFTIDNSSTNAQSGQSGQNQGQVQTQGGKDQTPEQTAGPAQPQATAPPARSEPSQDTPLSNDDIIKMVSSKVPDSVILAKIKSSVCKFDTSSDGLSDLQKAGVSEAVMNAIVAKQ